MRSHVLVAAALATVTLALAACERSNDRSAPATGDTPVTAAQTLPVAGPRSRARSFDLTRDNAPELLVVTTTGVRPDSLDVRLEIRARDGRVLYADGWNSRRYFHYDADFASVSDSTRERRVREQLDRLLADSAFTAPGRGTRTTAVQRRNEMREAIQYDIAEHRWRTEHGIPIGSPLPIAGHQALNRYARAVSADTVERLINELWELPTFRYHAGGEVTYIVAWSDPMKRFVRIFACC